ncbi:Peptide methionine sulfoxide reductase A4, chloroplastic [Dendrobium catenatum]|uniref:peptide-methionine (S)-S-oxide reductase n=1 Tax=Dendrobium catenatum TaxID=906689 RepID=A0A2I0WXX1_9ASPA|nr:Peptide methionine sulfoxide reductase A4, chloroplastic [Dendrobium catenatum]
MAASSSEIAYEPDNDVPAAGQQLAQFGAGCFWGVELAFQRVPGVTKTEVGYSQGKFHNPTYKDVCTGKTGHSEIVRLEYDPNQCRYEDLLDVFWARHDPTTLNRQDVTQCLMWISSLSRRHFNFCVAPCFHIFGVSKASML